VGCNSNPQYSQECSTFNLAFRIFWTTQNTFKQQNWQLANIQQCINDGDDNFTKQTKTFKNVTVSWGRKQYN
jgi:hypothetical protein